MNRKYKVKTTFSGHENDFIFTIDETFNDSGKIGQSLSPPAKEKTKSSH
jgi:hypothetical protein